MPTSTSRWPANPKWTVQRLAEGLQQLRETLPLLPQDPYLLLNHNGWQSKNVQDHPLPDTEQVVAEISQAAEGLDLVGFYAAGPISRGFASSSGAFGWHQANSFNFDFSLFHANGQAVKASYAGHDWNSEGFAKRLRRRASSWRFSAARCAPCRPDNTAPIWHRPRWKKSSACSAGAVSRPSRSPAKTVRCKAVRGQQPFSPLVSVDEKVSGSLSPAFSGEGYPRSDLTLIIAGKADAQMVNSRSAAEYGLTANGASGGESPSALNMAAGTLPRPRFSSNWAPGCTSATCGT